MEVFNRDFKGVWIPREIWLEPELGAIEKIILAEIDSLDTKERGCYASNKHFSELCFCSESTVTKTISKLSKMGYIKIESFDGRTRIIRSRIALFINQTGNFYEADSENLRESNTYRNTDSNTKEKIEKRKSKSAKNKKSAVDDFTNDEELKSLIFEFIKMRKEVKKPMTDRAVEMLLHRLEEIAKDAETQKKVIKESLFHSWMNVYPLKEEKQKESVYTSDASYDLEAYRKSAIGLNDYEPKHKEP